MILQTILTRLLDGRLAAIGLQRRPSRLSDAGTLLAAGAVGALVGAGVMALLAPVAGVWPREGRRGGLDGVRGARAPGHPPALPPRARARAPQARPENLSA
jgi:hypothetical protein